MKKKKSKTTTPEEHEDGLREGLEVVVAVDLRAVHHGDLPKHLAGARGRISPARLQLLNRRNQQPSRELNTCIPITA